MSVATTAAAGDAREELKTGYALAQAGKCDEAIPHLKESHSLEPRAVTLINLADCEEKVGKLADAMTHWADARSRARTEGVAAIEQEASTRASALDARVPRLTIALARTAPPEATVERDGVLLGAPSLGVALPLDPGEHVVVVKTPGGPDATFKVSIAEGETKTLDVDVAGAAKPAPSAAPASSPGAEKGGGRALSPLVFAGFGVAAAGLGVGVVTGVMALGKGSDAEKNCPGKVCSNAQQYDDVESGKTLRTVSTVGFIVAGVGAAVGVVGLFVGGKKKAVDVAFGPTSVLLRGAF